MTMQELLEFVSANDMITTQEIVAQYSIPLALAACYARRAYGSGYLRRVRSGRAFIYSLTSKGEARLAWLSQRG
jgi:hypothetical protein